MSLATSYGELTQLHPRVKHYRLYYAQALHKAGRLEAAERACAQVDSPSYRERVVKLRAAIKYGMDDIAGTKALVDQCSPQEADTIVNHGCIAYKEGRYADAAKRFEAAVEVAGYTPHNSYHIALCAYRQKQYGPALKAIGEVFERAVEEHPELNVGMTTEGIDVPSVGNTQVLHQTALVEAFNLRAAIEFQLKNCT